MFIQTESTPNPATLKFLPGRAVLEGGAVEFTTAEDARQSPLASALFAVNGVTTVFFGGDITFRGFKDGIVFLKMKGACAGCPSSTATLKHGIQNLLKHFLPDVRAVEQV